MAHLGAGAEDGVFDLHESAHLAPVAHLAVGADVGEGTYVHVPAQNALIDLGGVDHAALADFTVGNHGVRADFAVFSDHGAAPQDGARQQNGSRTDGHTGIDIGAVDIHYLHAGALMKGGDFLLHRPLKLNQLPHGVEGEHHAAHRQHGLMNLLHPAAPGKLGNIPLVVLLGAGHGGRALREAGGRVLQILAPADNKKTPDAFFQPCPHTPIQNRAKQRVLQHQGFSVIGLCGVLRQKDGNTFLALHWNAPLSI